MPANAICPRCGCTLEFPPVLGGCAVCLARALQQPDEEFEHGSGIPRIDGVDIELPAIAQGGMGVVYRAVLQATGETIAVKTLSLEQNMHLETVQRLRAEARMLEHLRHPNIVRLLAHGEADGQVYIIMEWVEGDNLQALISQRKVGSSQAAVRIVAAIADALVHAHAHGVLHLDIKPGNVLVAQDGTVKVADFGLARMPVPGDAATDAHSGLNSSVVAGTRHYLAPEAERLPRVQLDERADVFALGTLLYEVLMGEVPHGQPLRVSRLTGLPSRVDAIISRARERDRDRRYASVAEFRHALGSLHHGPGRPLVTLYALGGLALVALAWEAWLHWH